MQNDIRFHKNSKFLSPISLLFALCSLLRYRFFLFAGIFPYFMGQMLAFHLNRYLNWKYFWLGFLGISLVLVGVELFNEYFDAKEGGDRIFAKSKEHRAKSKEPRANSRKMTLCSKLYALSPFLLALCSMLFAFFIGLYLSLKVGWPILLFSFLGFLGAYFYVGPPIRWAYRGFGEIVIAFSYGPFMVLGSYYLQTKRFDALPIFISLILGLLIFSLSVVNEMPDYYQDRLVGKRNLVVRFGRRASIKLFGLSQVLVFIVLLFGIWTKLVPFFSIMTFLFLPWVLRSIKIAQRFYDTPRDFLPAIRMTILTYLFMVLFLFLSYII